MRIISKALQKGAQVAAGCIVKLRLQRAPG
jgi:hypothetical protein